MTPLLLLLVPIMLLAVYLPGWWVLRTLRRYSTPPTSRMRVKSCRLLR